MRCTGDNRSTPTNVRTFSAGALPSGFLFTLVFLYLVDQDIYSFLIGDKPILSKRNLPGVWVVSFFVVSARYNPNSRASPCAASTARATLPRTPPGAPLLASLCACRFFFL
jgi:hypothetical protein